ncbi:MAG TPA: condensation domain-containing protein, partial [Blastocatellia bacterium]|nr:condensation domain-containing protein [Blastocatellia bacterium]
VGSPIANRTRAETERLIGFFANTLVLRTRVDGDSSFKSLLQRVREVCLGAYAHQDLPFDRLVEELRPERELGETPLFQVMFAFQQAPRPQLEIPDLTLALCDIAPDTAKFDLCLGITETARQVQASLRYNREIFSGARMSRLIGHFNLLLESIAATPDLPICQLPMITPEERQAIKAAASSSKKRARERRSSQTTNS